jgi:methionyl-tRNA formyltransferase
MRLLYFANNRAGLRILEWLTQEGEQIAGLVVHPPQSRLFGDAILETAGLDDSHVFQADELDDRDTLDRIGELEPELGVSVFFGYILRPPVLGLLPRGCVNVHPALLPFNRGRHPNVWSIVDQTPAGATLHYIDEGVDTGDVIAQTEVPVASVDTGETLYAKLEDACLSVFQQAWPSLRAGTVEARPQEKDAGTSHRADDLQTLDRIDLDATYRARDLINQLRARTFPPHEGAHFIDDEGRKVDVRIELTYGAEEPQR